MYNYFVLVVNIHNSVESTVTVVLYMQTFNLLCAFDFQLYVVLEQVASLSPYICPHAGVLLANFGENPVKICRDEGLPPIPSHPVPSLPVYSRLVSFRTVCNGLAFHLGYRGGVEFGTVKLTA